MLPFDFVYTFLNENTQGLTVRGENFTARCPLCGDSRKSIRKRRFGLHFNGGEPVWHCFNCEQSGTFVELYSRIKGLTIGESLKELRNSNFENLQQVLSPRKRNKMLVEMETPFHNEILKDCLSVDDEPRGVISAGLLDRLKEFIKSRRIPPEYALYIACAGDYMGRIIVPVFDENGNLTYFQGRSTDTDRDEVKYKNPTLKKGSIVLNKHLFNRDKYIIVTEGLIDAMMVEEHQGTSALGRTITDEFLDIVTPLTSRQVIVCLDNDKDGKNEVKKLVKKSRYAKKVMYFQTPYPECKDLNDIRLHHPDINVYQMVVDNSYDYFTYLTKCSLK